MALSSTGCVGSGMQAVGAAFSAHPHTIVIPLVGGPGMSKVHPHIYIYPHMYIYCICVSCIFKYIYIFICMYTHIHTYIEVQYIARYFISGKRISVSTLAGFWPIERLVLYNIC